MAPKPIDNVYLPTLSDKSFEFFHAIWTFICGICIATWSHVSHVCWVVWTWPPFEATRSALAAFFDSLKEFIVTTDPLLVIYIFIIALLLIPGVAVLAFAALRAVTHFVLVVVQVIITFLVVNALVVYDALSGLVRRCLGFRSQDVLLGSSAANYQSTNDGGDNVPGVSVPAPAQLVGGKGRFRPFSDVAGPSSRTGTSG